MPRRPRPSSRPLGATWGTLRDTCSGKKPYAAEHDAQRAAELAMLRDMSLELSVYRCDLCRKWHLTRRQDSDNARA